MVLKDLLDLLVKTRIGLFGTHQFKYNEKHLVHMYRIYILHGAAEQNFTCEQAGHTFVTITEEMKFTTVNNIIKIT